MIRKRRALDRLRERRAVNLSNRVRAINSEWYASEIAYLYSPREALPQAVHWDGPGYYISKYPNDAFRRIGVDFPQAESEVRRLRRRHNPRPKPKPDEVVNFISKVGNLLSGVISAAAIFLPGNGKDGR